LTASVHDPVVLNNEQLVLHKMRLLRLWRGCAIDANNRCLCNDMKYSDDDDEYAIAAPHNIFSSHSSWLIYE